MLKVEWCVFLTSGQWFLPKRCAAFAFPQYSEKHTLSRIPPSQDWQAGHRCYWQLGVSVSCYRRGVSSFKMVIKDVFPSVCYVLSYHYVKCHRSVAAILCINGYACVASCFTSSSRFANSLHTLTIWVRLFAWSLWWFRQDSSQVNLCLTTLMVAIITSWIVNIASLKIIFTGSFQWNCGVIQWVECWIISCQSPLEDVPESWNDQHAEPLFKLKNIL